MAYDFVECKIAEAGEHDVEVTLVPIASAREIPPPEACDVIVVGSGAGGLAAATAAGVLGLKVLLLEKDSLVGGTTALSGGFMWLPGNPVSEAAGISEKPGAARTYLAHEAGNHFDVEKVEAFLGTIREAVGFYQSRTDLHFDAAPEFSDYHPEAPGGLPGGRSILAQPYDASELGAARRYVRPPLPELRFMGMSIGTGPDLKHFTNATRSFRSALYVTGRLSHYLKDRVLHGGDTRMSNGAALAGRLLRSALDAGVVIRTDAAATRLVVKEGRVDGLEISTPKGSFAVKARCGVVLAAGGFPQDRERRAKLFPHENVGLGHLSPAPQSNTGDGLRIAEGAGAALVLDYPNAAAWVPVSRVPRADGSWGVFPHFIDRGKPGLIAVRPDGRRFTNEANSYHDFMQGLFAAQGPRDRCNAFLIVDRHFLRTYGLGFVKPFPVPYSPHIRSGYLKSGRTIAELARNAGIDGAALARTIEVHNRAALEGVDREFGKGSTAYNRFYGDPRVKPNPCLAPIARGPYFAVEIFPGDLGTFDGIRTNAQSQVIAQDGAPISGLYAVGNDAASIAGGNYPGGGITLGPAIVFAYIAARHLVRAAGNST